MALIALWPGVASIGLAYAVVSREAGLSALEIQLLCLAMYSGAAQFAVSSLLDDGASSVTIIATTAVLSLRHILYGISASRWLPSEGQPPRALSAHFLVDESYGIAEAEASRGRANGWYLLGAGLSLYMVWNLFTAIGLVLSEVVELPSSGLDFIFPLSFVAITVPLVRHRLHLIAALVAVVVTIAVGRVANAGIAIFLASLAAVGIAAVLEPRDER